MSNDTSFCWTLFTQTFPVPLIFNSITLLFCFQTSENAWCIFIDVFPVIVECLLKVSGLEGAFFVFFTLLSKRVKGFFSI